VTTASTETLSSIGYWNSCIAVHFGVGFGRHKITIRGVNWLDGLSALRPSSDAARGQDRGRNDEAYFGLPALS
jgi:hypothetical protein